MKFHIIFFFFSSQKTSLQINFICRNFCLQILLTRIIPSIKLNNKLKVASCFLWCNFLGYIYHINLHSKRAHSGDRQTSIKNAPPEISNSENSSNKKQMRLSQEKADLSWMVSPAPIPTCCSLH